MSVGTEKSSVEKQTTICSTDDRLGKSDQTNAANFIFCTTFSSKKYIRSEFNNNNNKEVHLLLLVVFLLLLLLSSSSKKMSKWHRFMDADRFLI